LVVEGETVVGMVDDKDLLQAIQWRLSGLRSVANRFKDEARHDALTGLANRRYFDAVLERESSRCQRTGDGLGLVMIDIDHFKSVNDRFGHARGDHVLREVALRLGRSVRSTDLVARVGGEEFAILAPVDSHQALLGLAEKVRQAIAIEVFRAPEMERASDPEGTLLEDLGGLCLEPQGDLNVTVSIGAALLEGKVDSPVRLFRAADHALYAAKRAGRNRVERGHYQSSTADLPAVRSG
jgi:diguanylate cyclase (GGDEF)-like protein